MLAVALQSLPVSLFRLDLAAQQLANHLAGGDSGGVPEGLDVEGAGEAVGEAKEEHGGDPAAGVLEGEARLGHLVLLDDAAVQVVHGAGRVDLGRVLAGHVRLLDAREDVEVVVGGVAAGVALGANGSAEDDEILGDAWIRVSIFFPSFLLSRLFVAID